MTHEAPLPSERRERLISRVRETGSARVSDLSRWLGVTPVTVRRDLALLVLEGTLEKVHGGARIPARAPGRQEAEDAADVGQPTIGVVVPSLDYYWPEVIRGARAAAHGDRVTVSVTGAAEPELGARFWLLVDEQRVSLRRFEAFEGTCSELSASLSAAIALAIEALDLSEFPEPPPKPRPVLPAAKLTARAALAPDPPPEPAPARRRRAGALQSAALGAQLVGGFGVAPAASVGAGLRGELGFERGIAIHAGGNYLVMDSVPISDGTLAMRAVAGQLGVCWGRENHEYRAQGCLDVWTGAISGTPSNLERQSRQTLPWLAVAPGAEVLFQRDRDFGMRLGAQLSFNLVRPSFEVLFVTQDETIDEQATPPLGFMLTLGLDWVLL